jgi:TolB protein
MFVTYPRPRPDGTEAKQLTNSGAVNAGPAWLAGGQGLVFSSNRDGLFELYLMNSDGLVQSRLTISEGDNTQPSTAAR